MQVDSLKRLTDHVWLNLFVADISHGEKRNKWYFASRKMNPHEDFSIEAVTIVPIWHDYRNERRLVMIREFRPTINDYILDLPSGLIDKNESPIEAAKRELQEETGLILGKILCISPKLYSSPGLTDESTQFIFAECSGRMISMTEGSEDITPIAMTSSQIANLLQNGTEAMGMRAWLATYIVHADSLI